ncbi:trigger factor [Aestuariirhabdus litorea]|uniref:Trigger factor n=1 Tax=Aestuariirhabdus litorea TaxID=2528527 RepID=A0A3P3VQA1_9GAMM|nr:trigger factor [Aestuariirhabdus litorea]RRJ84905.1 trigger factor [Aestuariirhabdus litorea]RWW98131.1 trigger factor [Endozoicomonadaceae bacterium GTF-13]
MQVSVEATSGLERRLTITVPAERIDSEVNKRLQETARKARIDGFRPGKVPMSVIKRRFGPSARQEVVGEVIQSTFFEAVQKESLNPAGMPSVEPKAVKDGEDFEYVATFEVYPEIALGDFSAISIEKPVAEVTEADVDEMLETLRGQNKSFTEEVERGAQEGDQLKLGFVGKIDGEVFEGGSAESTDLILGSGRMIPGFEEGLEGVKAGEERTIDVTFPENYQAEELAGKLAQFTCTVSKVIAPVLPELNDEFFAKFGVAEGGIDAFRDEVRKNMQRELDSAIKNSVKNQVMDGLRTLHQVEIPKALVANEVDTLRKQAVQQFGGGQNIDLSMLPAELFEEQAQKRVSLGLVVAEIVKSKELKADDARVRAMVEEMAAAYQEPQQVIDWYMKNEQQLQEVRSVVLEEQVVDTVLADAKVSEKACSYKEAIAPEAPASEEGADSDQ